MKHEQQIIELNSRPDESVWTWKNVPSVPHEKDSWKNAVQSRWKWPKHEALLKKKKKTKKNPVTLAITFGKSVRKAADEPTDLDGHVVVFGGRVGDGHGERFDRGGCEGSHFIAPRHEIRRRNNNATDRDGRRNVRRIVRVQSTVRRWTRNRWLPIWTRSDRSCDHHHNNNTHQERRRRRDRPRFATGTTGGGPGELAAGGHHQRPTRTGRGRRRRAGRRRRPSPRSRHPPGAAGPTPHQLQPPAESLKNHPTSSKENTSIPRPHLVCIRQRP